VESQSLTTDPAALAKEAANFERIAGELKTIIAQVEQAASNLEGQWQGKAAKAAQGALAWFHEAAGAQVRELNDISTNLYAAGVHYANTDGDQSNSLAAAMGMDGNGLSTSTHHRAATTSAPLSATDAQAQVQPATGAAPAAAATFNPGTTGAGKVQAVDFKRGGGPGDGFKTDDGFEQPMPEIGGEHIGGGGGPTPLEQGLGGPPGPPSDWWKDTPSPAPSFDLKEFEGDVLKTAGAVAGEASIAASLPAEGPMLPVGIVGLIAGANAIGDDLEKIVGDIEKGID
jgi:WXG100 family type VII secretion target